MEKEKELYPKIKAHLDTHYPDAVYLFDEGGEMSHRVHLRKKGVKIPDLIILHASSDFGAMVLEVKKDKDDTIHAAEQWEMLTWFRSQNYFAQMGEGLANCLFLIDSYFGVNRGPEFYQNL